MLKKRIVYIISIILILGFILISSVLYNIYYIKINFVGNTTINFSNINEKDLSKIEIRIITPRNYNYVSFANDTISQFNYGKYRAFNNLLITIPDSILNKITLFTIKYNYEIFKYNKAEFLTNWKIVKNNKTNGIKVYEIPSNIKTKTKTLTKIISCFYLISFLFSYEVIQILKHLFKILSAALILFLIYKLYKKKLFNYDKRIIKRLLILVVFSFIFAIHLIYALSEIYLFTTGYVFIIAIFIIIYYIIKIVLIIFKADKIVILNTRLLMISISIALLISELIIQLLGNYSLYLETRNKFYYYSFFKSYDIGYYHIRTPFSTYYIQNAEYNYIRTANSLGLSDKETNVNKLTDEYRIIGLGDSFTEGDGTDKDSTWLKELERNMNKYSLKQKVSFINAGICGSDPYFEYILLKDKLLKYKPNLIIAAFNYSEIDDIIIRGGIERFAKDSTISINYKPLLAFVYGTTHISRVILNNIYKFNYLLLTYDEYETQKKKALDKIYKSVEMISQLAKENNFKLIITLHPSKPDIKNNNFHYFDSVELNIKKNLPSVEVFNMYDYFINVEKIDSINYKNYYWILDGHHNAKGYSAFGRGIEYELNKLGIIDSLKNSSL